MNDLKKLNDQALIEATDEVAAREREALISVLEHLREIERRRLFSALGYSSLWDYAVKRLKYSEDQAWRRISAMRLLRELPELEEKIESGALTLTNLGLAQSLFKAEAKIDKPLAREDKSALLFKLEGKSKREAEQIIIRESSQATVAKPDKVTAISEDMATVQFTADKNLLEKIERLKGLLAHSHPDLSLAELMHKLCDLGLEKLDPSQKPTRERRKAHSSAPEQVRRTARQPISTKIKREVWSKCSGKCKRCGSRRALQIEHIFPLYRGGTNALSNLTMLCRSCNQRTAIEKLGFQKMDPYLNPVDKEAHLLNSDYIRG